jgi:hypothetical protein
MAINFWKNTVIQNIYKDSGVIQQFRKELAKDKIHIITISVEELKEYIKELARSTPQGAGVPLYKEVEELAESLYRNMKIQAKTNKKVGHFMGESGKSFTIRTVGLRGYELMRSNALKLFFDRLKNLGIDLKKQVKDRDFGDTTDTQTFMTRRLQFSHGDEDSKTTVGALKGLEIFNEMEENIQASLKRVKGKADFSTTEVKQAMQEDLTHYYQHELKIDIKHEDPVAKGKIKDNYIVYGRMQTLKRNKQAYRYLDANTDMDRRGFSQQLVTKIEQAMLRTVGKEGANLEASDKLSDRAADAVIAKFRKQIKAKGAKVLGGGKTKTITSKRSTGAVKNTTSPKTALKKLKSGRKIKKPSSITNMAGVGTGLIRQQQRQRTKRSNIALAGLMSRLNSALPYMVRENMGSPRLNYRGTGREGPFTSTVRVTGVTPMNRKNPEAGGVNINYTYGLYPYQTFEPGFEQGDFYRDPRKLIEESIFELARNIKSEYFMRGIAMRRTATGRDYRFKRGN